MTRVSVPDVSAITEYLYISAWLRGDHADEIRAMDVRLILSMHWFKPARNLGDAPIRLLWLPTVDNPFFPMPIRSFKLGVDAALPVIQEGYGVLTHCRAGVHRSVAMACCVLIGMGHTAEEAMQLVKQKRSVADPSVWYIRNRILKFEQQWLAKK
jgi:protein-tyrosine phosphatase